MKKIIFIMLMLITPACLFAQTGILKKVNEKEFSLVSKNSQDSIIIEFWVNGNYFDEILYLIDEREKIYKIEEFASPGKYNLYIDKVELYQYYEGEEMPRKKDVFNYLTSCPSEKDFVQWRMYLTLINQ